MRPRTGLLSLASNWPGVVSTLVFLASTCASFLFVNLAWAFLTRAGRDVELAPFVFFGAIWLALALLVGEIVLVGRRTV